MNLIERLKDLINNEGKYTVLDTLGYHSRDYLKDLRAELILQHGGQDMGSDYHYIIKDLDTGKFYKIDGHYSSYTGVDWDDWDIYEVEQKPVQTFEYVKVEQ